MRISYIFFRTLYEVIGKHMPSSYCKLRILQKEFRYFCAKRFINHIGINVNIERGASFSKKVSIGDNSGIGINAYIQGECYIGKNVMMGPSCTIYTINHEFSDIEIPMCEQGIQKEKPVYIGDDVWIGSNVIILPGVIIEKHSIIGAGAVVTKNVPEKAIVAGNPARIIRYRS